MATKKKAKTTKVKSKPAKAKPAPKKKKTPAKKKAVKKVVNPYVGKRFFKVEFSGYGGELIVGKSSEEFVDYWLDDERNDMIMAHMHAMSDMASFGADEGYETPEGYDMNSPEVYEGSGNREYWEFDDIEHETMVSYEHNQYSVTEIQIHPQAEYADGELRWNHKESTKKSFDWSAQMFTDVPNTTVNHDFGHCVVSRELYINTDKNGMDDPVPVIMMYDSQKGTFGSVYIMTNGEDFDPNKFVFSALDNTMSNNAEMFFYDKQMLSVDNSWLDTWGKGAYASVGYVEKSSIEYNFTELLEEGWKYLEE
jgi:hypothetical protein